MESVVKHATQFEATFVVIQTLVSNCNCQLSFMLTSSGSVFKPVFVHSIFFLSRVWSLGCVDNLQNFTIFHGIILTCQFYVATSLQSI